MNLTNSLYTSVFKKKMLKKLTHWKKKKKNFTWTVQFALFTCSTIQWTEEAWYTVQWIVYHATLFTEQCIMVELRAAQESSIFLLFICLRFARNLLWDPCKVNNFFFLTKHLLSAFLKKRNLYLVAKRAQPFQGLQT